MLTWFRWATLMTALSAASYYGYRAIPWSYVDATVSAYWIQAFGSVGALCGAIWIARADSNRLKRIENNRASLAMSAYSSSFKNLHGILGEAPNSIDSLQRTHDAYLAYASILEMPITWGVNDLEPLTAYSENIALRLALAYGKVTEVVAILKKMGHAPFIMQSDHVEHTLEMCKASLKQAHGHMDFVILRIAKIATHV